MENDRLKEMEQRYTSWSTEDLIRSTTFERNQYEREAITLMENELKRRGTPQEELDLAQENVKCQVEGDSAKLNGIKGLLLLFIIVLIFNLLYMVGVGLVGLFTMLWNPSLALLMLSICDLSVAGYGFFTVDLLIDKSNNAPKHTMRWLYCILGVGVLDIAVMFFVFDKLELLAAARYISFALVWMTYFTKSRRVAITYGIERVIP